ncbi:peptide chain release factor N(5)-glutamine methyltransferase [Rhodoferax sp. U2-2l]|uniref:peptide chain release factor N(5)-glutamine methyltransferase n=1 Tax=Rhodoferax sp. U2-2l TaxID=2884000 RepID=UPI001D0AED25|nr:peptide chain release factor N(5)-glutamine methyltransferase [Rhodoferax sp. U2-2l]MCB8745898.1 peptide chain release factor N(5)-glutamine methyltransferase [Rhodoferax sp. U2-2l]
MAPTPDTLTLAQTLAQLQQLGLDRLDAQLLLLHALSQPDTQRGWLLAHDTDRLPAACVEPLQTLTRRRLAGEPLAYLTGRKAFYGLNLHVNPDVLVPRPDTETLVDWALEVLSRPEPSQQDADTRMTASPGLPVSASRPPRLNVLDLGTGSGAIALALKATHPALAVWATDLSAAALATAQGNAQRLGLAVHFAQGAWLAALPSGTPRFDCIVANPPYIAEGDAHLPALRHEPTQALTSGADGLDDLRQIITQAPAHLLAGGWLLLEHGFDQATAVRQLLVDHGFVAVQSHRDLAGIERCTGGQQPATPSLENKTYT